MRISSLLILGFLLGLAVAGPFYTYYHAYVIDYTIKIGVLLLWGAMGVAALFAFGFSYLDRFARRKLGVQDYSAAAIAGKFNTLLWDILGQNREAAQRTSEQLITQVVSFGSIVAFYRWSMGVFLTILAAIGGTLGLAPVSWRGERLGSG